MQTQKQQSYDLGFIDGQKCGAHLLTTYDTTQLIELLGDTDLKQEESFFLGFLKTRKEIAKEKLDYPPYLDGFHAGYREALGLDSENLDIGEGG